MMPTELKMIGASVQETIMNTISSGSEDPFYVVQIDDFVRKHKNWLRLMPRVRPFYAVKCNPSRIVLETLGALGLGFDCASKAEIDAVLKLGVLPSQIIYANPCKSPSYIKHAAEVGVDLMTFDSAEELHKIATLYGKARLVLRIKVDDSHSVISLSSKFGADPQSAPALLKEARELGLNVVGVSFHVGTGCQSADSFTNAIGIARSIFDMGLAMGFEMTLLDLGGGFPGTSDSQVSFEEIALNVNQALDVHFPAIGPDGKESSVAIIAEPGRYYVASAFTLVATIIAKRVPPNGQGDIMYYLNDGIYGSFSNVIFEHWNENPKPLLPYSQLFTRKYRSCTIWGPTCDSIDCIKRNAILPEMEVGEWLCFPEMGAYSIAISTHFNGFPTPRMKYSISAQTLEILSHVPLWSRIGRVLGLEVAEERPRAHSLDHFVANRPRTLSMDCIPVH